MDAIRNQIVAKLRERPSPEEQYLAGLSPTDALGLRTEMSNRAEASPEQRAANLRSTIAAGLSIAPIIGNAMSARDVYEGAGDAYSLAQAGDYKQAAIAAGLAGLSGVGAVTGLPTSRAAGAVARDAADTVHTFPAWHASAKDFDKFDLKKVGTGQGDAVAGHGVYLSESPDVAEFYRRILGPWTIEGNIANDAEKAAALLRDRGELASIISDHKDTIQKQLNDMRPDEGGLRKLIIDKYHQELQPMEKVSNASDVSPAGKLYNVEVDSDPGKFLNWDVPVPSHQASAFEPHLPSAQSFESGADAYQALARELGSQKAASDVLHQSGIPGIQYTGEINRLAPEGANNYVVFDEGLLKIKGKQ